CVLLLALGCLLLAGPREAMGVTAQWESPALDLWQYLNGFGAGSRALSPTFTGGLDIDPSTGEFVPHPANDPARVGMTLVASDTSGEIEAELLPGQYQVDSVRLTFTMESATSGEIQYDDTPDSHTELLADLANQEVDTARPMEL